MGFRPSTYGLLKEYIMLITQERTRMAMDARKLTTLSTWVFTRLHPGSMMKRTFLLWILLLGSHLPDGVAAGPLGSESAPPVVRQGARAVIYNRQLTVDGAARDCTRPQIIPSRSPSRESLYTCCEGWKLQKNNCIPDEECFTMRLGQDYRGYANKTSLGNICVPWTSDKITPHLNESMSVTSVIEHVLSLSGNNCRNPWSDRPRPWCFVEPRHGVIAWEFCNVGKPHKTCNMAKSYRVRCGPLTCNHGQICHESNQMCGCRLGYHGNGCEERCDDRMFGMDCSRRCECSDHEHCHHVTGTCNSSEDDSDNDDNIDHKKHPADRLPPGNGTASMCRSACGILSKIGCTCTPDGGACKCPSYVIALFVVSITTWITLGTVCVVCTVRRRRYASKIEYKRDSDYCEELDSDDETELGANVTQPTTATTTTTDINTSQLSPLSLNESSMGPQPLPPLPTTPPPSSPALPTTKPPELGNQHVRFVPGKTPASHRPELPSDPPPPEPDDSSTLESSSGSHDSHLYLNVDRETSVYSIDYSHPYDFLNANGANRGRPKGKDSTEHAQMSPECFLLHYMAQQKMRALNNAKHGYVNDSVAKWQERKISNMSKRLFSFGHQGTVQCSSNSPAPVVTGATKTNNRNESREIIQVAMRRGKPTIKPKPDVLKLLGNNKAKVGPHERLLEKSESVESETESHSAQNGRSVANDKENGGDTRTDADSNPRYLSCQHLRPAVHSRAGSAPSPSQIREREDDDESTAFSFSEDHIYENSQIRTPCVRVGKSRSADVFNPI